MTYRLLKQNKIDHEHKLFAKAFLEKIFNECLSAQGSRELNINNINLYSKIIGILSIHVSEATINNYIQTSIANFQESNEFKQTFEYLSTVLNIYERNSTYTNIPENLGSLVSSLILKLDKEY